MLHEIKKALGSFDLEDKKWHKLIVFCSSFPLHVLVGQYV